MMTILLDCDDVLLDWVSGFRKFASRALAREIEGEPTSWSMAEWIGGSDNLVGQLIAEFNRSEAFGELEPVPGAQLVVQQMHEDPDTRLHVITSCSTDPVTVARRRANLERHFGVHTFDSVHCLDLGESKKKLLQAWRPGALWIDDNYKNAVLGADVGHRVMIRTRPHNQVHRANSDPRLFWFDHWSQLGEI